MPDKDRLTTLDCKLAYEEWRKQQDQHEADLRREGAENRDPWVQAHQVNRYETIRRAMEKAKLASADTGDQDATNPTTTR